MLSPLGNNRPVYSAPRKQAAGIAPVERVLDAGLFQYTQGQESDRKRPVYRDLAEAARQLRAAGQPDGIAQWETINRAEFQIGPAIEARGYLALPDPVGYGYPSAGYDHSYLSRAAQHLMRGLNEYHAPATSFVSAVMRMVRKVSLSFGLDPESHLPEGKRSGTLRPEAYQSDSALNEPQLTLTLGLRLPKDGWAKVLDLASGNESVLLLARRVQEMSDSGGAKSYVPLSLTAPASVVAQLCEIPASRRVAILAAAVAAQEASRVMRRTSAVVTG